MAKSKVTKEMWLNMGLKTFAEGGMNAINVEKMARSLGCSKGSFYWYFENRGEFVNEMLQHWVRIGTEEYIESSGTENSPEAQLERLLLDVFKSKEGRDFMFHLRHYSQNDKEIARILKETEDRRILYIVKILQNCGLKENLARDKAELAYHYYLGWYERTKYLELSEEELYRQVELLICAMGVRIPIEPSRKDD
ncbi:MAG: TetR/AcrR family transcriptional regulator [Spirochaetota bacterium]|nr:TetR/AcrR family transcriptional regulator [Spirochaetota bacterium]